MNYLILIFISNLILFIYSGEFTDECTNVNNPKSPGDCIKHSYDPYFCCLLESTNTPLEYRVCNLIMKNATTPIKVVGKMNYRLNCTGVPDFEKYFPFENNYKACGVQYAYNESRCSIDNTDDKMCCLASTEPTFNSDYNPMCYYYKNQVGTFKDGDFYFKCSSDIVKIKIFLLFLIILLI